MERERGEGERWVVSENEKGLDVRWGVRSIMQNTLDQYV
jgi:hypothetical protein